MKYKKALTFEEFAESVAGGRSWREGAALARQMSVSLIFRPGRYEGTLEKTFYEAPRGSLPRIVFYIKVEGVGIAEKCQEIATPVGMANLLMDLSRMGIFPKRMGDIATAMAFLENRCPKVIIDIERIDGVQMVHFVNSEDISGWKSLGYEEGVGPEEVPQAPTEPVVASEWGNAPEPSIVPDPLPVVEIPQPEVPVVPVGEADITVGDTILVELDGEMKEVVVLKDYGDEVAVDVDGVKRLVGVDEFKGLVKKAS